MSFVSTKLDPENIHATLLMDTRAPQVRARGVVAFRRLQEISHFAAHGVLARGGRGNTLSAERRRPPPARPRPGAASRAWGRRNLPAPAVTIHWTWGVQHMGQSQGWFTSLPRRAGRPHVTAAVVTIVLGASGLLACDNASGGAEGTAPPQGIVLDLDGQVAVLPEVGSKPKVVGPRPAGTEKLDAYQLDSPRQLASGRIAAVRRGNLVAISPDTPTRATLVAPASDWFMSSDGQHVWAVTEEPAATACAGTGSAQGVTAKYTAAEHETNGRPSHHILKLPCGYEPVADTPKGLLAQQTTGSTAQSGNGSRSTTRIVIMNAAATSAARTLTEDGTVIDAARQRVVWHDDNCSRGSCFNVYDTGRGKSSALPACLEDQPVGIGELDSSGRWYTTIEQTAEGKRLAVLDLEKGGCKDLGAFPSLELGDANLDTALPVAWTGANLLALDTRSGELTSYNAASGKSEERVRLSVGDGAQVWGALPV
ncbi:hypothetical protein [Streptomyces sp. SAS_272]|uniref:hypothetical protein n=1 Tax=Streptomyces sp. SAS_272 TaxID=3412747 RepID=UPI00403CE001